MPGRTRLTPRHGSPRDDVRQVRIPGAVHRMLYEYAQAHNLTFGDAAERLIGLVAGDLINVAQRSVMRPLDGAPKKQVKVPRRTHAALLLFAGTHNMTIGDAAALLIGVGLMKTLHLDPAAFEGTKRLS